MIRDEWDVADVDNQDRERKPKLMDMGWLNHPTQRLQIDIMRQICQEQNHKTTDIDVGPPNRGMDHVVSCATCGYVYHYDSSD
jgi:hypothetical protein